MPEPALGSQTLKRRVRAAAEENRRNQPDKDEISRAICARFAALPEYKAARTVMLFVHFRDEVRTQAFLAEAVAGGRRVVVPYCTRGELELFHLESTGELEQGTWGILEPRADLRIRPDKRIDIPEVDLVMVPGVAFDRRGGRVGHGKGYYDRLLRRARPDTPLVAAAFECQVFPDVPMLQHDVWMDKVLTEREVYQGRGR